LGDNPLKITLLMNYMIDTLIGFVTRILPLRFRFKLLEKAKFCHDSQLWLRTVQLMAARQPSERLDALNLSLRLNQFKRRPADLLARTAVMERSCSSVDSIPEIDFKDITIDKLREAMSICGALVVRNGLESCDAEEFRAEIDNAREAVKNISGKDDLYKAQGRYYVPLSVTSSKINHKLAFGLEASNIMLADSPPVFTKYIDKLRSNGLRDLIVDYFNGVAALSVEKSVLRRAEPDDSDKWDCAWHQDGAFLGEDIRSLNMWVALSDCGVDAPSLDLITNRYHSTLPTGTDRAPFTWSLGPDLIADEINKHGYEHLTFNEGDLIFFDHFNVHRTGMLKGMKKPRYAIECWFFSEFGFPEGKTGMRL